MFQVLLLTLVVSSAVGTREKPPQCKLTGGSFMEGIMDSKKAHLKVEDKLEDAMAAHHGHVQVEDKLEDAMASQEEHLQVKDELEDAMASREEHLQVKGMTKAVTIHTGEEVGAPKSLPVQGAGTNDKEKIGNAAEVADETTVLNRSLAEQNQSCTLNQFRTSEMNQSHTSELKHYLTVKDAMIHNLNLDEKDAMIHNLNLDEKDVREKAEEEDASTGDASSAATSSQSEGADGASSEAKTEALEVGQTFAGRFLLVKKLWRQEVRPTQPDIYGRDALDIALDDDHFENFLDGIYGMDALDNRLVDGLDDPSSNPLDRTYDPAPLDNRFSNAAPLEKGHSRGKSSSSPTLTDFPKKLTTTDRQNRTKKFDLKYLAKGSFGQVWKAKELSTNKMMALKIFYTGNKYLTWDEAAKIDKKAKNTLMTQELENAAQECANAKSIQESAGQVTSEVARDAQRLMRCYEDHVSKAKVSASDTLYLVLEDCGDQDLLHWAQSRWKQIKQLGYTKQAYQDYVQDVRGLFKQIIEGLRFLSEAKWIHHDFHAGNIMVKNVGTKTRSALVVKIVDFGFTVKASEENSFRYIPVRSDISPPESNGFDAVFEFRNATRFDYKHPWAFDMYGAGVSLLYLLTAGEREYEMLFWPATAWHGILGKEKSMSQIETNDVYPDGHIKEIRQSCARAQLLNTKIKPIMKARKTITPEQKTQAMKLPWQQFLDQWNQFFSDKKVFDKAKGYFVQKVCKERLEKFFNKADATLVYCLKAPGGIEDKAVGNGQAPQVNWDRIPDVSTKESKLFKDASIQHILEVIFTGMVAFQPEKRWKPQKVFDDAFLRGVDSVADPDF